MIKLTLWMRIVGAFYLFLLIAAVFLKIPIQVEGPPNLLAQAELGNPAARFVIDTWVILGLILGVLGASLLYNSQTPSQARILIWTIIDNEMFGIWALIFIRFSVIIMQPNLLYGFSFTQ